METKIIVNPDAMRAKEVKLRVRENDGYCPCALIKNDDTKCPCTNFLKSEELGECHCGLYIRIERKNAN